MCAHCQQSVCQHRFVVCVQWWTLKWENQLWIVAIWISCVVQLCIPTPILPLKHTETHIHIHISLSPPHTSLFSNLQGLWAAYKYSSWQSILFSCFRFFCPVRFFLCCFLFSFLCFNLHCRSDDLCRVASIFAALPLFPAPLYQSPLLKLLVPPCGEEKMKEFRIKSKVFWDLTFTLIQRKIKSKLLVVLHLKSFQHQLERCSWSKWNHWPVGSAQFLTLLWFELVPFSLPQLAKCRAFLIHDIIFSLPKILNWVPIRTPI